MSRPRQGCRGRPRPSMPSSGRSLASSFWCLPTGVFQTTSPVSWRTATTFPVLPEPMASGVSVPSMLAVGEDGCGLEVEVEQVMCPVLVVPAHRAGRGVDGDHRGRVQVVARAAGAIGAVGGHRPRSRVADAEVDIAVLVDGRRVPQPATTGDRDCVEAAVGGVEPPFGLARPGIEGVQHAPIAAGIEGAEPGARDGADIDGAVIHDGRHVDTFAGRATDLGPPHDAAVGRVERDDLAGVAQAGVDHVIRDGHAIGADAADIERGLPVLGASVAVEREHIAAHVLDVDRVTDDDRLRGDAPEEAGCRDVEGPGELQVTDGVLEMLESTALRVAERSPWGTGQFPDSCSVSGGTVGNGGRRR